MEPDGSAQSEGRESPVSAVDTTVLAFHEMVARAMGGLSRPGMENGSDRGENEKNWPRKARSVISGVFGGAMLRLTCYSRARVDARGCTEAVAEDEKEDGSERTGLDSRELIYGSGRGGGGGRRLEGSVRPSPLPSKDVADSERGENSERRGEEAGPYGQMVPSKRHRRAMLRLSTVFNKNPRVKLLDLEVGKSNGTPRSTMRARAVAWAWTKLQCARQKMKVKAVCYRVSNPMKEEDRKEEEEEEDGEEEEDNLVLTDEEEEGGELELCKKRILMGRRCKPLDCSGALQYDNNGVLSPESLP